MLVNLTVASPFYLVTQILLTASVHPTGLNLLWMWLVPACYLVFSSVLGITVNLLFPNFKWENEVRVVKQSASMSVYMLIGVLSGLLPLLAMAFAGERLSGWICPITVVVLLMVTVILYRRNNKTSLMAIGIK